MAAMSFREKSAWISFISIALVSSLYFSKIAHVLVTGRGRGGAAPVFLGLVALLIVLEVALHIAIAMQSPHEARTPKDERERLIEMKATRIAFPVLLVSVFAAIGTLHLPGSSRFLMADAILLAIVVGQLTRFGAQIVYHRRGF
jgi:uncharacterized membrane protein